MNTAFQAVINNKGMDRHFGGTAPSIVADPYISGYHYTKWTTIPALLNNWITAGDGQVASGTLQGQNINRFLAGSCLSVTPPGGTLNKTEFTGIGGIKWAVPTNIDYGNVLTMKFLEFSHLPV